MIARALIVVNMVVLLLNIWIDGTDTSLKAASIGLVCGLLAYRERSPNGNI